MIFEIRKSGVHILDNVDLHTGRFFLLAVTERRGKVVKVHLGFLADGASLQAV